MRLSLRLNLSLVAGVTLVSLAIALYQTQSETRGLKRDLERHAVELADSLEKSAAPLIATNSLRELHLLVERFQNNQRLVGVAVYTPEGLPLAISSKLEPRLAGNPIGLTREQWSRP